MTIPATPKYDLGNEVTYRDRQGRVQNGVVLSIEANWFWKCGQPPLVVYTVEHPTYRNKRISITEEHFL